jgi:hypothetical protein
MSAARQLSWLHRLWRLAAAEDSCSVGAGTVLADPAGTEPATPVGPQPRNEIACAGLTPRARATAEEPVRGAARTAARRDFGWPL